MSGLMSRNKGLREERALVHYLLEHGWTAHRIPLSGATENYKHDVVAEKNGQKWTIELKTRASHFKRPYELFYQKKLIDRDPTIRIWVEKFKRGFIMSENFDSVVTQEGVLVHKAIWEELPKKTRAQIRACLNLARFNEGADVLAIRSNNKPRLFFRYL